MRNPNAMLKLIAELLEKATNKITAEYREEQLKAIKLELQAKSEELSTLKDSEKGKSYSDEEASNHSVVRAKNITDILIPFFNDDLAVLDKKADTNDAALESIDELQLQALERIEKLKANMSELRIAAEERAGEFQTPINEEITKIAEEISTTEAELKSYVERLAELIIRKAELNANSKNAKKVIAKLETELASLSKDGKPVSFRKAIVEAKEAELSATVDQLKKRKKLLETKPEVLAEDLTMLVKNGATEDEIKDKLVMLKKLAGETAIDLETTSNIGFVAVPSKPTTGVLNSQASFYKSSALNLQQNAINNTILISKMVAGIIYYIELINRARIVKSQLSKDLQTFEKEFTRLPAIRANIKKAEETIAGLEKAKGKMLEVLETTVIYNKENAVKQCSSNFMESQAVIGLSQLESKSQDPFAVNLENLDIMSTLLSGIYQLPSDEIPEDLPEGPGLLEQLRGEEFGVNKPVVELGMDLVAEDLSLVDPNTGEKMIAPEQTLLTELPESLAEPIELSPLTDIMPTEPELNNIEPKPTATPIVSETESKPESQEKKVPERIDLVQIPVAVEVPEETASKPEDRYVPYRKRNGNISPFRLGTPTGPYTRVDSVKNVKFGPDLIRMAFNGVPRDSDGMQKIGVRRV